MSLNRYKRFEFDGTAVYIDPEYPDWIAVNKKGDEVLKEEWLGQNKNTRLSLHDEIKKSKFLENIIFHNVDDYTGRSDYINLNGLEECWLHITDNCNLKCTHCLFSCSPELKTTLDFKDIEKIVEQTYSLGSRIFYITGGEPFVHKNIKEIIELILGKKETSIVLMTNGILIPKYLDFLKTLPKERLFFQISADGTKTTHEETRGKNSFNKLIQGFRALKELGTRNTIAMTINKNNIHQMKDMVDIASSHGIDALHFMWLIVTGSAKPEIFVEPEEIFPNLVEAYNYAVTKGIEIDNVKNMESQIFSPGGTKYDLGNPGWTSIAFGPDKKVYPTAAMIGTPELVCGNIEDKIEDIYKNSETLDKIRKTSVADSKTYKDSPFKYITGGGDIDHSFFNSGEFEGNDPYLPLYEKMILWIISENAKKMPFSPFPEINVKMGDRLLQCHSHGDGVSLTHSNCVLTFSNTRKVVGDFYTEADTSGNEDIINPVCYPEEEISHIPDHSRIKSYGCGSPVLDAGIKPGESIADLGSGAGVECFIASKKTGKNGKVYGIDMLDHMLSKAEKAKTHVEKNLGYKNLEFKKGFLEKIPLNDNELDLITSNCVINLSEDKRETLKEILRVLKPGGRIVISDVVTDFPSPPSIQNDEQLQGECIAGAMVQTHLFSMLESIGFTDITILKRFFYRNVKDHNFYSLTYTAYKPAENEKAEIIYPGPFAAVITDDGKTLIKGKKYNTQKPYNEEITLPSLLVLDEQGNASNIEAENSCCCYIPPEQQKKTSASSIQTTQMTLLKNKADCMVCKKELIYLRNNEIKKCHYCSNEFSANAVCEDGHFVCDACHGIDAMEFAKNTLVSTDEKDLIVLMNKIRSHKSFNLHGPEHHFAVPGVIAAVYKNNGGNISNDEILTAIERGSSIPGGSCAFWGGCGAPLGAGIGFGVILDSNPLKPKPRQIVQNLVAEITKKTASIKAARCCQREVWTTLEKVSELSEKYLGIKLPANGDIKCRQMDANKECIKKACPYYD